jgi:hypothetical protein
MQGEEKLNDVELEKESRLWRCEGDDGVGVKVKIIMQQARAFHHFAPRISCKFSLVCIWGLIGSRETLEARRVLAHLSVFQHTRPLLSSIHFLSQ